MLPSMARVTLIWCETSLSVSCAVRPASSASTMSMASSFSIRVSNVSLAPTRSSISPAPENAAQRQPQKPGDHREQDDVEILLKLAHRLPRPATVLGAPGPGPHIHSVQMWRRYRRDKHNRCR